MINNILLSLLNQQHKAIINDRVARPNPWPCRLLNFILRTNRVTIGENPWKPVGGKNRERVPLTKAVVRPSEFWAILCEKRYTQMYNNYERRVKNTNEITAPKRLTLTAMKRWISFVGPVPEYLLVNSAARWFLMAVWKENCYPAFFTSWRVHWPYLEMQVYELITWVRRANENARNLISGVQFLIIYNLNVNDLRNYFVLLEQQRMKGLKNSRLNGTWTLTTTTLAQWSAN